MQTSTLTGAIGLLLYASADPCCSGTDIYRCQQENGPISYQQFPCKDQGKVVEIRDRPSGWSALRAGERELLNSFRQQEAANRRRSSEPGMHRPDTDRTCWNRRRELEEIRLTLRRGYTLQEARELHRQRDNHRDYLQKFCR